MSKRRDKISTGQLACMVWASVLAAAAAVLPGETARIGGAAGWLAPVIATPGVLAVGLLLGWVTDGGRQGLAQVVRGAVGGFAGGLVTIIYIMWGLLLAAARLRLSGQRLVFTAQRDADLGFFLVIIAVIVGWLGRGRLVVFARTAAILFRGLLAALFVVVLLTALQVQKENLLPVFGGDVARAAAAAVPVLGVACYGVYGAFFFREVRSRKGDGRRWVAWGAWGWIAATLLVLCVLGNLGSELAAHLEDPFITLAKNVGVEGAFQRVESLVSSLWLPADLTLITLMVWAGRQGVRNLWPRIDGDALAVSGGVIVLIVAATVFRDTVAAQCFERQIAPAGNLVLGVGVPLVLGLLYKLKKTGEKGGTSCDGQEGKSEDLGAPDKE